MCARAVKAAKERYLVVAYLMGSDCYRYWALLEYLENNYVFGNNKWPSKLTGYHHLLTTWNNEFCYASTYLYSSGIRYAIL